MKSILNVAIDGSYVFSLIKSEKSDKRPSVHLETIKNIAGERKLKVKVNYNNKSRLVVEFSDCPVKTIQNVVKNICKNLGVVYNESYRFGKTPA